MALSAEQFATLPPGWTLAPEGGYVNGAGVATATLPGKSSFEKQAQVWRESAQQQQHRALATVNVLAPAPPLRPWLDGSLPPPRRLEFLAWFQEGSGARSSSIRRSLLLAYDADTGQFSTQVQGNENVYVLSHITDHRGSPLSHLDLHVGCKIDCLGRITTIMQAANLATSEWIDQEAAWLKRLAGELSAHLLKYGHAHGPGLSVAATPVSFRKAPAPGSVHLRRALGAVESLYQDFVAVRPTAAAAWAAATMRAGQKRVDERAEKERRKTFLRGSVSGGGSAALIHRTAAASQRR
jgi:hypothetical protein